MKKQAKKYPKDELLLMCSIQHAHRIVFSEMQRLNDKLEQNGQLAQEEIDQLTKLIKCCNDLKRTENAIDKGKSDKSIFKDEGELADIISQPKDFLDNEPIEKHDQLNDIILSHKHGLE